MPNQSGHAEALIHHHYVHSISMESDTHHILLGFIYPKTAITRYRQFTWNCKSQKNKKSIPAKSSRHLSQQWKHASIMFIRSYRLHTAPTSLRYILLPPTIQRIGNTCSIYAIHVALFYWLWKSNAVKKNKTGR